MSCGLPTRRDEADQGPRRGREPDPGIVPSSQSEKPSPSPACSPSSSPLPSPPLQATPGPQLSGHSPWEPDTQADIPSSLRSSQAASRDHEPGCPPAAQARPGNASPPFSTAGTRGITESGELCGAVRSGLPAGDFGATSPLPARSVTLGRCPNLSEPQRSSITMRE